MLPGRSAGTACCRLGLGLAVPGRALPRCPGAAGLSLGGGRGWHAGRRAARDERGRPAPPRPCFSAPGGCKLPPRSLCRRVRTISARFLPGPLRPRGPRPAPPGTRHPPQPGRTAWRGGEPAASSPQPAAGLPAASGARLRARRCPFLTRLGAAQGCTRTQARPFSSRLWQGRGCACVRVRIRGGGVAGVLGWGVLRPH